MMNTAVGSSVIGTQRFMWWLCTGLILCMPSLTCWGGDSGESIVTYKRFYGVLPPYEVEVFRDRSVVLFTHDSEGAKRHQNFVISKERFDQLVDAFEEFGYSRMKTQYFSPVFDGPAMVELNLHYKDASKTLLAHPPGLGNWPPNLFKLVWAVEDSLDLRRLLCPAQSGKVDSHALDKCEIARREEQAFYRRSR